MNPDRELIGKFVHDPTATDMHSSPLLTELGARLLSHEPAQRQLTMLFTPPEMYRQGAGVVQGGALSMMLDFVMAFSAMAAVPKASSLATLSMSTDFIGAARGESLTARGLVEKAGRSVVFTRGWLMDGEKKVASAQSSLMIINKGVTD